MQHYVRGSVPKSCRILKQATCLALYQPVHVLPDCASIYAHWQYRPIMYLGRMSSSQRSHCMSCHNVSIFHLSHLGVCICRSEAHRLNPKLMAHCTVSSAMHAAQQQSPHAAAPLSESGRGSCCVTTLRGQPSLEAGASQGAAPLLHRPNLTFRSTRECMKEACSSTLSTHPIPRYSWSAERVGRAPHVMTGDVHASTAKPP